jgi:hypothetical protein
MADPSLPERNRGPVLLLKPQAPPGAPMALPLVPVHVSGDWESGLAMEYNRAALEHFGEFARLNVKKEEQ